MRTPMRYTLPWLGLMLFVLGSGSALAQKFTRITDPNNPIVSDPGPGGYTGATWIDFDSDNDLDLFINNTMLYRNDGGGQFVRLTTNIDSGQSIVTGNGNTWADYDNDGDADVYVSSANSFLYRNDGGGVFTKITAGAIGDGFANRGWSSAWGDFNNDGNVDLAITHPAGFVPGGSTPNHLYLNDGPPNYTFTRIDTGAIVTGLAPYTVGTWSDFDQDGDVDYFVGAGPANGTTAPDFLYRNMFVETGRTAFFQRISSGIIATEAQDGQVWNWIDYDNDGDLDAYLTNWGGAFGGMVNRLYRNDGGTFTKVTTGNIVTDSQISLSSVWGDFDNDGDLDCYVANDSNQPDRYYRNEGNGSFTRVDTVAVAQSQTRRGATAGDYDNDGDLDLLAVGPGSAKALYRNDTPHTNNWININCIGQNSNRSALGTRVRAKAQINGTAVWQMREVSAQNNFNGQNSLRVHFGLGNATVVDSLVLIWPAGTVEVIENVTANGFYAATEGQGLTGITGVGPLVDQPLDGFELLQNYPNPFNPSTTVRFRMARRGSSVLKVYDLLGQEVKTLINEELAAGAYEVNWDGRNNAGLPVSSGIYLYRLEAGRQFVQTRKMILLR